MSLSADFAFTQGSLGDYADCARRFELRYIKRLRYPALEVNQALEYERRLRRGNRFHKLVQQHLLGLPADLLAASLSDDADLARWWENYRQHGLAGLPRERQAEITLQTTLGGQRLLAKYDLLALERGGAAVIVDWKTGERIPSRQYLQSRMQTVVYRYVLARAGGHLYGGEIPPERIRMEYVYVAQGGQRVSLPYSAAEMAEDEARLLGMIQAIGEAAEFPLTEDQRRCRFCAYRAFCGRGEAGDLREFVEDVDGEDDEGIALDFDQIAEIEF